MGGNFCASVKQQYRDFPLCFDRLADAGFNGVRINLFWGNFIDQKADNTYTVPVPVKGDGSQLDLLDYCVYLARQKGMVFWFSFDRREFKPGDYDLLPDDGTRDEWTALIKEDGAYSLVYLDRRAEKVFETFARNVLDHVNPYTGLRYADDPAIALYEVFNENGFVDGLVNTGYKDKPVMARRVRQRWNEWLKARYGTDDRLSAAWGALASGESLTAGTVAFAPVKNCVAGYAAGYQAVFKEPGKQDRSAGYPARRGEDVMRFACDLSRRHTQRFTQAVRQAGGEPGVGIRVAPITPTGVFNSSLPANYAGAGGDRLFNLHDTNLGDLEGRIRQHSWREGTRIRYLPNGSSELPDSRWNTSADRVAARVTAPWLTGLTYRKYDFSRRVFAQGPVGGAFVVTAAEPLFYARLTRP
jgi:hypothetical protein